MQCPKCGEDLVIKEIEERDDVGDLVVNKYGICHNCRKKFRLKKAQTDDDDEDSGATGTVGNTGYSYRVPTPSRSSVRLGADDDDDDDDEDDDGGLPARYSRPAKQSILDRFKNTNDDDDDDEDDEEERDILGHGSSIGRSASRTGGGSGRISQAQRQRERIRFFITIGVIAAIVLAIFFLGFAIGKSAGKKSSNKDSGETSEATSTDGETGSAGTVIKTPGYLSDEIINFSTDTYTITYTDVKTFKDSEGREYLRMYYNFTNNSTASIMFKTCITQKSSQNGIELVPTTAGSDDTEVLNQDVEVAPNQTILVGVNCGILQDRSPVKVEVGDWLGFDQPDVMTVYLLQE
ncbi:MAG: DUF5067 domain-containing protein [Lachnospiraceae bacterium]|jgi:hypothetical protein|nr:DUF5067 domain-containing protein [Lachnospiraceae bacterium]